MPVEPTIAANLAEPLHDDEIHVWQLAYQRAAGRTPLRQVLAGYLGTTPERIGLLEDEHGRPRLDPRHRSPLDFNWSHSGERAVLAIARNLTPGIDLERVRERPRALAIAERYFSAAETRMLSELAPPQRSQAFLQLWTAKEAVLKAHGRGIAFGLHRLDIHSAPSQLSLQRFEGEDVSAWQLQALPVDAAHVAALAWRGEPRRIRLWPLASMA